jgi:hypothetical protein
MSNKLPGLSPLWLIGLALILGIVTVALLPVSIAGGDTVKGSDWIGFAGSVIAGAMTFVAGVIAWFSVQVQIKAQEEAFERSIQRQEHRRAMDMANAKEAARLVLAQPIHAAAAAMNVTKRYIETAAGEPDVVGLQPYGGPGRKVMLVKRDLDMVMVQLKTTLSHFAVAEAWKDLSAEDKSNYLIITSTLHTVTNIYSDPSPSLTASEMIFNQHNMMMQFAIYVRAFDDELADIFDRDANHGRTEQVVTQS